MDCQGTCSKAKRRSLPQSTNATPDDPISDEMLKRGRKAVAGPPRLGKNYELLLFHRSSLSQLRKKTPKEPRGSRSSKHSKRAERRLKLSITAQKKKKEDFSQGECSSSKNVYQLRQTARHNIPMKSTSSLPECSVVLERLTKKNIYYVCRKFKVKLLDKSALGIKSRNSRSFSNPSEINVSKMNCDTTAFGTSNEAVLGTREKDSSLSESSEPLLCSGSSQSKQSAFPITIMNSRGPQSKADFNQSDGNKKETDPLPKPDETFSHPAIATSSKVITIEGNVNCGEFMKETAEKVSFSEKSTKSSAEVVVKKQYRTAVKNDKHKKAKPSKVMQESVNLHERRNGRGGITSPISPSDGRISGAIGEDETPGEKMHNYVENISSKSIKFRKRSPVCSNKEVKMSQTKENSPKRSDILKTSGRENPEDLSSNNSYAVAEVMKEVVHKNEERNKILSSNKGAPLIRRKVEGKSDKNNEITKKYVQKSCVATNDEVIRTILQRPALESPGSLKLKLFKIPKISKSGSCAPVDMQQDWSNAGMLHSQNSIEAVRNEDVNHNHGERGLQRRSKRISNASFCLSTSSNDNVDANGNNTVLKAMKSPIEDKEDNLQNPKIFVATRKRGRRSESGKNEDSGVDTTGEISSAHSTIYEEMEVKETSGRDAKDSSKNSNSLVISLDTSDIRLYLSDVDETATLPTCNEMNMSVHKNAKSSNDTLIPCVDGATESSSDSSSGSRHEQESVPHHTTLKRKISEWVKEGFHKSSRKYEDVPDEHDVPESESHWFAQPYAPWSFWSPNTSPKSHHHFHVFSPPRPVSPENTHGRGLASVQGCMEKAGPSNAKDLGPDPPEDTLIGLLEQSQPMESTPGASSTDKNARTESSFEAEDNSSRETSQDQSILDIFCEKSFSFSEENSDDDLHNSSKNITIINLSESPSHTSSNSSFQLTPQIRCSEERFHALFSENIRKELAECDTDLNMLPCRERSNQASNISSESSEFQCGQQLKNKSSENIGKETPLVLPTLLKTLKKPPSRREIVDSLSSSNIPDIVNQGPFCSNYFDVKGKTEVGGNVLDLKSNSFVHLEEFQSSITGLRGLRQQQKSLFECIWGLSQIEGDFNQLLSNHMDRNETTIAPVKKPPTVREVALWTRARQIINKKNDESAEKHDLEMERKTVPPEILQEESVSKLFINISFESPDKISSPLGNTVQASTPDTTYQNSGGSDIQSALFTPILQLKSQFITKKRKSGNYLRKLASCPSPLPSVPEEEDDMGVKFLDAETVVEPAASDSQLVDGSQNDSSLRRLLLDSQFCKDVASPAVRHMADASACQIKGSSSSPGFKLVLENLQSAKTNKEYQYITLLTVEVHVCTCGTLKPDPERDPIRSVFFSVMNDVPEEYEIPSEVTGIIAVDFHNSPTPLLNRCGVEGTIQYSADEKSLLQDLIHLVRQWDPDILAGFEIEMLSWGYLLQRASVLGLNLIQELSRIPNLKETKQQEDFEENNRPSGLKITGRIVLDVWRLFRSEVALQSYTFENLMYHILHQRVSYHSFANLSHWWENETHLYRWITVRYYQQRVLGVLRLLDQLDIIGRTSELARLFGIQFFEVLSRGSQFRVESMMLRLAKPLSYIPLSPSIQQRAHMRAPECLPLIMEPESRFYSDPVIVLDFQSLYPSMIIAYNYCFSTCLGRVEYLGKSSHFEFGCSELRTSNSLLRQLKDNITVSPSGIAFVKKATRQGILPRMLEEILEARLAVKQSMKQHKGDHTLQRVLHARQLGLKLIANVTYGYTAANFSGRMPCIEVGDSVVSKGRETLERAISLVQSNHKWRAKVVYGDTDSLFVLVPGRSRQDAFRIGAEIANAVTQANPSPVKLKLEKVYQPSILQTKKRYVGFMYESPDQVDPVYEAKGIETVRRDGCPAVAKMLEKSLRLLFKTCDVSSVKSYVSRQFAKILSGQANIQDLIFAREYRGKENYRAGACVPALELTKRWLRQDRRAEPRIGERVPYIVVNGPPGSALIHLVRHPSELLSDPSLRYNAVYYITRAVVPPLARCLSLIGADVLSWYTELPRRSRVQLSAVALPGLKKTISQYFTSMECACCGDLTHGGVCDKCQSNPQLFITSLMSKLHSWEKTKLSITKICQSCVGRSEPIECFSLDCPILFRRHQASETNKQSAFIMQVLNDYGISS